MLTLQQNFYEYILRGICSKYYKDLRMRMTTCESEMKYCSGPQKMREACEKYLIFM